MHTAAEGDELCMLMQARNAARAAGRCSGRCGGCTLRERAAIGLIKLLGDALNLAGPFLLQARLRNSGIFICRALAKMMCKRVLLFWYR